MPFDFSIDTIIFSIFLCVNLALGLFSSRGIRHIKDYAVGDRNFSTATIAATIVATWVGGGFFFSNLAESYDHGLYFIWIAVIGDFICLFAIAQIFAPRMGEFLGKLSIAEAMGDLFGKKVRIITAFSGFIGVSGIIAIQFKIASSIFAYVFVGFSTEWTIAIGVVATLYSAFGGIKSVTFTDVIQFFTFGVVIPSLSYFLLNNIDYTGISTLFSENVLFDYKQIFDFSRPKSFYYFCLLFYYVIPIFDPAIFQRISIAKDTNQVRRSFSVAAIVCTIIAFLVSLIAVLILLQHPNISSDKIVENILSDHSFIKGFKGFLLVGIMAIIMSTVDSYINSSATLIVHDFLKPIKLVKNELMVVRIVSLIVGVFAIMLSLLESNLLDLILFTYSFYAPIVSIPFGMAVLGFRSSTKSVLISMLSGFTIVVIWNVFNIQLANSVVVGMLANLIALLSSHYLLKQPGGWVGIKDKAPLMALREERRQSKLKLFKEIKNFNLLKILKSNCPAGDGMISLIGFFVMISTFTSTHTLPRDIQLEYKNILDIYYPIALFMSTLLISYPLWLDSWKNNSALPIVWNSTMFFVLIVFSFSMVLVSHFHEMQMMAFMMNITLICSLIYWRWSLFTIIVGLFLSNFYCNHYLNINAVNASLENSNFKIIYLILLISGTLILFLKPRQAFNKLTEDKVDHLSERIEFQNEEIEKLVDLKHEFLRNLEHETRTPITGITSLGQVLDDNYDKFDEKQRRSIISDIAKSGERLNSLASNLIDLSKLSTLKYSFTFDEINLSDLVLARAEECKKLYMQDSSTKKENKSTLVLKVQEDITVKCDQYYISRTIDNLIINAIQYCKDGEIVINLSADDKKVAFSVSDNGIGIPDNELIDIFGAFTVSSRTRTPA